MKWNCKCISLQVLRFTHSHVLGGHHVCMIIDKNHKVAMPIWGWGICQSTLGNLNFLLSF